jgi:uncharacterized protein YecT (DUF1311 family)
VANSDAVASLTFTDHRLTFVVLDLTFSAQVPMPRSSRESRGIKGRRWPAPLCSFVISPLLFGFCSAAHLDATILARDADTELSIDPPGSPDANGIFSFTHFADSASKEDFNFGGNLKSDGKLYRLEQSPDQKSKASVVIDGDLEGQQLEVKTSGLTDWRNQEYDFTGTYRKLSNTELQQRAQRRYEAADTWLNEIYLRAKQKLTTASFADLKKREAAWIVYRDYFADQSAGINARVESLPEEVARWQSLRDLTMSRINFIRSLFDDSLPTGLTGTYHDEYGGELDLEKDSKGVKFRLNVVRGPTSHTGDVSGRVVLRNGIGIYRDPQPAEGEKAAEITFHILDDRRVEIKARNDSYLHGARAYFDGVYFKSAPLTESIELE